MPPRFAYWTILIDNAPTAFRARDPQELLPTLNQLKRTNKDVVLKWFAHGRLWESQEQEREDFQRRKRASTRPRVRHDRHESRGPDWRPGGQHADPRARFDKNQRRKKRDHAAGGRDQRAGGGPKTAAGGDRNRARDRRDARSERQPRPHGQAGRQQLNPRKPFRPHDEHRGPKGAAGSGHPSGRRPNQRFDKRPRDRWPGTDQIQEDRPDRSRAERRPNRTRGSDRAQGSERRDERRDDRREQPERREQEPPPRRSDRPTDVPEAPPKPEQIVIKPEPPERG